MEAPIFRAISSRSCTVEVQFVHSSCVVRVKFGRSSGAVRELFARRIEALQAAGCWCDAGNFKAWTATVLLVMEESTRVAAK
ncbi:hypothetical protein PVL29_018673 [Vitis rotundifolia]|uniref:Uncharacterized protein n=1 Tax=Vitis rotundifolia TaxID=103349 RepID=A0AA39DFA6_VITRO|nr:hypothetical protein PVL29_018673 [Vitis rotundifolia]